MEGNESEDIVKSVEASVNCRFSLERAKNILERVLDTVPLTCPQTEFIEHHYFVKCQKYFKDEVSSLIDKFQEELLPLEFFNEIKDLARKSLVAKTWSDLPEVVQELKYAKLINREKVIFSLDKQQSLLKNVQCIIITFAQYHIAIHQATNSSYEFLNNYNELLEQFYTHPITAFRDVTDGVPRSDLWVEYKRKSSHKNPWIYSRNKASKDIAIHYEQSLQKLNETIEALEKRSEDLVDVAAQLKLCRENVRKKYEKCLDCVTKKVDGKNTLIVTKPVIILSKCLSQIESILTNVGNNKIEQVNLIATGVIYIDCDLQNGVWHGKNVLVAAEKVECIAQNLCWDVSGEEGEDGGEESAPAGTELSMDGSPGLPASPGESGGNCMFIADRFVRINLLTIKSNGGNGGRGQQGGDGCVGKKGATGKSMSSLDQLKMQFPSPTSSSSKTQKEKLKIIQDKISNAKWTEFSSAWTHEYYVSGRTADELEVQFGFTDYWLVPKRAYCIVKGGPGGPGGAGGQAGPGGCGGEGGYPGNKPEGFNCSGGSPRWDTGPSFFGTNGKPGEHGDEGKTRPGPTGNNGKDVGYIDRGFFSGVTNFEPGTYEVVKYNSKHDKVYMYCPYKKENVSIRAVTRPPTETEICESQKEVKVETRVHVSANHKNSIIKSQALETWQEVSNSEKKLNESLDQSSNAGDNILHSCRQFLESSKQSKEVSLVHTRSIHRLDPEEEELLQSSLTGNDVTWSLSNCNFSPDQLELAEARIKVLEKARESNLIDGFITSIKTVKKFVVQLTSTLTNDSALHAIFGKLQPNGYYEAGTEKRQQICTRLKESVPTIMGNKKALEQLRYSLTDYFEDKSGSQNNTNTTLDEYSEDYNNFKTRSDRVFDWDNGVLKDAEAIGQYVDFLANENIPLLKSDLKILAIVYGAQLKIYTSDVNNNQSHFVQEDEDVTNYSNENGSDSPVEVWRVALNEKYEFSRVTEVRDRSLMNTEIKNVVTQVYSMTSAEAVSEWGEKRIWDADYCEEALGVKMDEYNEDGDFRLKMARNLCADISPNERRLFVETFMLNWPPNLLHVFYDRVNKHWTETNGPQIINLSVIKILELMMLESTKIFSKDDLQSMVLWTIATCPVSQWVQELCLISAERFFEDLNLTDITFWRLNLQKFPVELTASISNVISKGDSFFGSSDKQTFYDFLESIQSDFLNGKMKYDKLDTVSRHQWPSQLRKLYLEHQLENLENVEWNETNNRKRQAVYYLYSLYNEKPNEVKTLLDTLSTVLPELKNKTTQIVSILSYFYGKVCDLTAENINVLKEMSVDKWFKMMQRKATEDRLYSFQTRTHAEILSIIKTDNNTSISDAQVHKIGKLMQALEKFQIEFGFNFLSKMKTWVENFSQKVKETNETNLSEIEKLQIEALAQIIFVIKIKLRCSLRDTQKLAIISALVLDNDQKNLLSQIATGEGKSLIVLSVAIIRGLFGKKSDVVTSSPVLAQRDAEEFVDLYHAFGLTVGDISHGSVEQRRVAYLCTVVFGDASSYQRDYLLEHFYNKNIRGARPFQQTNVIVDEVDSMFLDKGNCVLYLSHQPPDLDTLENLFVFIWTKVVEAVNSKRGFVPEEVLKTILAAIYPTVSDTDLKNCLDLSDAQIRSLKEWLIKNKIINGKNQLIMTQLEHIEKAIKDLPEEYHSVKSQLEHLLRHKFEDVDGMTPVMNYLKDPFVTDHLPGWIDNAFVATQLVEGKEYVVDVDHSNLALDKFCKVTILDQDTGGDLKDSQWTEALHQFVQLKHGCRLSPISLKAVFISNITFFKFYERIIGLTGTMGTSSDRNFLKTNYNVEFLSMPVALPKRFTEEVSIVCSNEGNWMDEIYTDCSNKLDENRSILIICGSVKEADFLYKNLSMKLSTSPEVSLYLYRRDYEKFMVTDGDKRLGTRKIIIATNLAGRGTDIKLSQDLRNAGGLHVILSYLPDNLRVEQQAFGRASRCGDKGSGRLIFIDKISKMSGSSDVRDAIDLKILRDELEVARVSDIQTYYTSVIKQEESKFKTFKENHFDKMRQVLEDAYDKILIYFKKDEREQTMAALLEGNVNDLKQLVMNSMLNKWAFYLDRYSAFLVKKYNQGRCQRRIVNNQQLDTDKELELANEFDHIMKQFKEVIRKYENRSIWERFLGKVTSIEQVILDLIDEPSLVVKAAKCLAIRKEFGKAERKLNEVKRKERFHSMAALYYTLFCRIKNGECNKPNFRTLCIDLIEKMDTFIHWQSTMAAIVNQAGQVNHQSITRDKGYEQQKQNMIKIITVYKRSVERLIGNVAMTSEDFVPLCGSTQVGQFALNHLVKQNVLVDKIQCVHLNDNPQRIAKLARQFCLTEDKAKNMLQELEGKSTLHLEWQDEMAEKADFPSRPDFFDHIQSCFEGPVEHFAVIQMNEGSTEKYQNDFTSLLETRKRGFYVCKYGVDMMSPNLKVIRGQRSDYANDQEYIWLEESGRLSYEQVAWIDMEELKCYLPEKHDRVDSNSFVGISSEIKETESKKIFENLQKSKIIDANGVLVSESWPVAKLDVKFEVYRADIVRIIHFKCRYKVELFSLIEKYNQMKNGSWQSANELQIILPKSLFKQFLSIALEMRLLSGVCLNMDEYKKVDIFQMPKNIGNCIAGAVTIKRDLKYEEEINKYPAGNTISERLNDLKQWEIWAYNIARKQEMACIKTSDLKTLFPKESDNFIESLENDLVTKGWITEKGEIFEQSETHEVENLSEKFKHHQPKLSHFRTWQLNTIKPGFLKDLVSFAQSHLGTLQALDTPDATLTLLEDSFPKYNLQKGDLVEELYIFTLNGFDQIIDTMETKWSFKFAINIAAVTIMGLAQVAVGLAVAHILPGIGAVVAKGFVLEGINDLLYAGMSIFTGRFNWQDYVNNKWISLAVSLISTGISAAGAFRARNALAKAGQSIVVAREAVTVSSTLGAIRSGMPDVLTRAVRFAAINTTTTLAYEYGVKTAVERFSEQTFVKIDEAVETHEIQQTLNDLVNKVGVERANDILERCMSHTNNSSAHESEAKDYVSTFMFAVMNGLSMAHDHHISAGLTNEMSNASALWSLLTFGVNAANVWTHLTHSVGVYLNKINRQILTEIQCFDLNLENSRETVSEEQIQEFIFKFKEMASTELKEKIGRVLQSSVIQPLMNDITNELMTMAVNKIVKVHQEKQAAEEQEKVNQDRRRMWDKLKEYATLTPEERHLLTAAASDIRDPIIVSYLVEQGALQGLECIQALANLKNVSISVTSDNPHLSAEVSPMDVDDKGSLGSKKTIRLSHRSSITSSLGSGSWESGDTDLIRMGSLEGHSTMLDAFNDAMHHQISPMTQSISRVELAEFIKKDSHTAEFIRSGACNNLQSFSSPLLGNQPNQQMFGDTKDRISEQIKKAINSKDYIPFQNSEQLEGKIIIGGGVTGDSNHVSSSKFNEVLNNFKESAQAFQQKYLTIQGYKFGRYLTQKYSGESNQSQMPSSTSKLPKEVAPHVYKHIEELASEYISLHANQNPVVKFVIKVNFTNDFDTPTSYDVVIKRELNKNPDPICPVEVYRAYVSGVVSPKRKCFLTIGQTNETDDVTGI